MAAQKMNRYEKACVFWETVYLKNMPIRVVFREEDDYAEEYDKNNGANDN